MDKLGCPSHLPRLVAMVGKFFMCSRKVSNFIIIICFLLSLPTKVNTAKCEKSQIFAVIRIGLRSNFIPFLSYESGACFDRDCQRPVATGDCELSVLLTFHINSTQIFRHRNLASWEASIDYTALGNNLDLPGFMSFLLVPHLPRCVGWKRRNTASDEQADTKKIYI